MKKLLYTLLAVSIIFSACEEEDVAPINTNNNTVHPDNLGLAIGDFYQGGIIFYLDNINGGGLVADTADQPTSYEWGCIGTLISGADGTAIGTGAQNTIDIEAGCTTIGTAADICANLTLGGYSDWFLPSKDELYEMYLNLHQQGLGGFNSNGYLSSTEYDNNYAWGVGFNDGYHYNNVHKTMSLDVKAVRAF